MPVLDFIQQLADENKPKWHLYKIDNLSDSPSTGE